MQLCDFSANLCVTIIILKDYSTQIYQIVFPYNAEIYREITQRFADFFSLRLTEIVKFFCEISLAKSQRRKEKIYFF